MRTIKFLVLIMLIVMPVLVSAQRARITFSFVMDQSGSQLSLDSIFVENLSSSCDTMLYSCAASSRSSCSS
ncbi:MAG: hypothetical protein II935_07665, partial [Bacteroidales bacterium]|nr:hypothetical protein [Bacteroidales bacterium]